MTYQLVTTPRELNLFNQIKGIVWSMSGFGMEYAKPGSQQFLFYAQDGNPGGTFEFTPSRNIRPEVRRYFDHVPELKSNNHAETDSFAVLPQYRGILGREIVSFMLLYALEQGYDYGIGLADKRIVRSFPKTYNIPTKSVGDSFVYKGEVVTPVVFDFSACRYLLNTKDFSWVIKPVPLNPVLSR